MQERVECQDVNGDHQNGPTGIEGFCEQGLRVVVFMNRLDDVFIGRGMTVPVFVVQTSMCGQYSIEVIDECSRQYSALITAYLLQVVLEG